MGLGVAKNAVQYKMQLEGCRSNAKDYKAKLDSVLILDGIHKKVEAGLTAKIQKQERKTATFKGLFGGLALAVFIRETITILNKKL